MTDAELMEQYAKRKSESAFHTLVDRYLPLVYSGAVRQVRNAAMAEDVAQVVFIILARKAERLSNDTILPAWLFRTTRHVASKALRAELRRQKREQEAVQMQNNQQTEFWDQAAPFLDEAIARLGEVDRGAILLHYFQNKRLGDVGLALGMSEDTAQKRVSRAVEKLRKLLFKRGVPLTVAVIPGLLMTRGATAAPPYLAAKITACALNKTVISTSIYAVLQDSLARTFLPTSKAALAASASSALLLAGAVYLWSRPLANDAVVSNSSSSQAKQSHFPRKRVLVRAKTPAPDRVNPPPQIAIKTPPPQIQLPPAPVVTVAPIRPTVPVTTPTNAPAKTPSPEVAVTPKSSSGESVPPYAVPPIWPGGNTGSQRGIPNGQPAVAPENAESGKPDLSPLQRPSRPAFVPRSNLQKKPN